MKKTVKKAFSLILAILTLVSLMAVPTFASTNCNCNASYSRATGNLDAANLPTGISEATIGDFVYFNASVGTDIKLRSVKLYMKTPNSSDFTLYDTESASGFLRYAYFGYRVNCSAGTLRYYFECTRTNGEVKRFPERSLEIRSKGAPQPGVRYYIISAANQMALTVRDNSQADGANVELSTLTGSSGQIFALRSAGNGYYFIENVDSGKVIDVENYGKGGNGANILMWNRQGIDPQLYELRDTGDGYFGLVNKSGMCVDVAGSNNIQVWRYWGTDTQRFKFVPCEESNAIVCPVRNYDETNHAGLNNTSWGYYSSYNRSNNRHWHTGIDLKVKGDSYNSRTHNLPADNVYALTNGTVKAVGYNSANGNYVVIQHTISGKTVYSFYGHLYGYSVAKGDSVNSNTVIGSIGWTGNCPGNGKHLHFAIANKLDSNGSYMGYTNVNILSKKANVATYGNVTFYNPWYVIQNGTLPQS